MHLLTKLLTVCLMLPAISWALPSDREKPINIEADHAQMDDQEGAQAGEERSKVRLRGCRHFVAKDAVEHEPGQHRGQ